MASDNVFRWLRARQRCLLASLGILFLVVAAPSYGAPQEPPAVAVVTDQTNVAVSDRVLETVLLGLKANGDVYFGDPGWGVLEWSAATGTRTRLLQINDPIPGYSGSVASSVGLAIQSNAAGHLALINSWAALGVRNPNGVFVYDGSQHLDVALSGEAVPGVPGAVFSAFRALRMNASDQVAFVAEFEPPGEVMLGVFLGTPSGSPVKIATAGELRSLLNGNNVDNIYPIGVDDAGNVAFLCSDALDPYVHAVVIGSPSGELHAIRFGDSAPGTTGRLALPGNSANYAFNANGDLAFSAGVWDDPAISTGIWVRSAAGTLQTLAVNGDVTGTALGGTYNSFTFRGLGDNGQVLYTGNITSGTTPQALFLKAVGAAADVLCYQNQLIAGGPLAVGAVSVVALNAGGKVAVVSSLKNPSGQGVLLCSAAGSPQLIASANAATPAGGTYSQFVSVRINASDQVLFRSDILNPNGNGLFLWTSGSPVRSVVNSTEAIGPGATRALYDFPTVVSDDEVLFWPYAGEGKDTIYTRSLHSATGPIRRIVGDGDAAPDGGMIAYIDLPAMNDREELVFLSRVIGGPTVPPAQTLWLSKPGAALQKLIRTSDAAPGSAGGYFSNLGFQPRINSQSEVAFFANISGATGSSNAGVFLVSSSGTVQKIARIGDSSPAGGTFVGIGNTIYLSDTGQVAFRATSENGTTRVDGLFVGTAAAAPVKLMAVGDAVGAYTFTVLGNAFKMNRTGQVVFWANISMLSGGIFVASAGSAPEAIALSDDETPVPGTFLTLNLPDAFFDINSSGQVAFWAVYWTDTLYETGYFVGSAGSPPVARLSQGQALPGGGTCPLFVPKNGGLALADSGELAMYVPGEPGVANLPRYIIAGADGALRSFAEVGASAGDTGSAFGRLGTVGANSMGSFLVSGTLVGGPARQGMFRSGLAVSSLTANVTLPAAAGTPITWTARATGGTAPLAYQFWVDTPGVGWVLARDYDAANTVLWTPSAGGVYRIQVWVRNSGSAAPYDTYSTVVSFSITGTAALVVTSLAADVQLPAAVGTPITWTATATGGTAPLQYQFWLDVPGVGWVLARDYDAANTLLWTPGAGGAYRIQVWVRNSGSAAPYDAYSTVVSFSITGTAALVVTNLAADVPLPAAAGTSITWTATAAGGSPPLAYQFWIDTPGVGWVLAQDYGTSNTLLWTPSVGGDYRIQVWVRTNGSVAPYDAYSSVVSFSVTGTLALIVTDLAADVSLPAAAGTPVTWTATATGGSPPLAYQFWIDVPNVGWVLAQGYSTANTLLWTPSAGGDYRIQVWVRNNGSVVPYDAYSSVVSFSITGAAALAVTGVTPDVTLPVAVGTPITWTATATGGTAPLEYEFWIDVPGVGWTLAQGYGTANTLLWTPTVAGVHRIQVWVRNSGSAAMYDAYSSVVSFSITGGGSPEGD